MGARALSPVGCCRDSPSPGRPAAAAARSPPPPSQCILAASLVTWTFPGGCGGNSTHCCLQENLVLLRHPNRWSNSPRCASGRRSPPPLACPSCRELGGQGEAAPLEGQAGTSSLHLPWRSPSPAWTLLRSLLCFSPPPPPPCLGETRKQQVEVSSGGSPRPAFDT